MEDKRTKEREREGEIIRKYSNYFTKLSEGKFDDFEEDKLPASIVSLIDNISIDQNLNILIRQRKQKQELKNDKLFEEFESSNFYIILDSMFKNVKIQFSNILFFQKKRRKTFKIHTNLFRMKLIFDYLQIKNNNI